MEMVQASCEGEVVPREPDSTGVQCVSREQPPGAASQLGTSCLAFSTTRRCLPCYLLAAPP
eukprot:4311597-Amphidinium_carterae.2